MNKGPVFEAQPGWGGKIGTWLNGNKLWLIPTFVVVILIIIFATRSGSNVLQVEKISDVSTSTSSVPMTGSAAETVIKGDSYTSIARRMIASRSMVSSDSSVALASNGARLYAETNLAQDLKKQPLIIGSKILSGPIDNYLQGYGDLYPSQRAKWEAMAKNVKF